MPLIQEQTRLARIELGRRNLTSFASYVDPFHSDEYHAPHLQYIARWLERAAAGLAPRLIINTPPRHWKTSILEKFVPFYLGTHPDHNIIYVSYAESLPVKSSRYIRDMISDSDLYHDLFPEVVLDKGTRDAGDWKLVGSHRSTFRAKGVGGGVTGGGANVLIIDDPIKDWASARSETVLANTWEWIQKTLLQRQEPISAIILLMTRWSADDPTGQLLRYARESGGSQWTHIRLPAYADKADDLLGRPIGAPLWPDRWPLDKLKELENDVGEIAWRLTYQQDDGEDEGLYIKKEWFRYWPRLPDGAVWKARAWDLALTEKENVKDNPDYTASVLGTSFNDSLWLGGPIIFRANWPDVVERVMSTMIQEPDIRHGTGRALHETAAVQALMTKGFWLDTYEEVSDPMARASAWISEAAIHHVQLVGTEAEWKPFTKWWWRYPAPGSHDDSISCTSGVSNMLGYSFMEPEEKHDPYAGRSLDSRLKEMFRGHDPAKRWRRMGE